MRTMASVILLSLLLCRYAPAADVPAEVPPLPVSHTARQIEGWTVRVDDRLLEGKDAALGERAIKLLTARLVGISVVVPEATLAKLREVTIQLDLTHGALRPMQYHPSAGWLRANGYSERLAKCVWGPLPEREKPETPAHRRRGN